jgi:hypothetical protein
MYTGFLKDLDIQAVYDGRETDPEGRRYSVGLMKWHEETKR